MFFSVITKNLNWKILTKNLVTFKRWDGVKDEKFLTIHWKNLIFMGRVIGQFADLTGGAWWKRERGFDTPMHTMTTHTNHHWHVFYLSYNRLGNGIEIHG